MIAMSPTVTMKGEVKFSMKKFIGGAQMAVSTFTGPGELLLAPAFIGDIVALPLSGSEVWTVGKDAFLACTERVHKELKTQKFSQAMFSGEGLFTYKISGSGIVWLDSLGAVIRKDVSYSPPECCDLKGNRVLIVTQTARRRREIHRRQRPPRRLELRVQARARRVWRYHQQHGRWRGSGVQVPGPGHRVVPVPQPAQLWPGPQQRPASTQGLNRIDTERDQQGKPT